jgi:alpha-glucosidase
LDDEERFAGEVGVFGPEGGNVETRMGWGGGEIRVGSVGKALQTMGMARVGVLSLQSSVILIPS